MENFKDSCFEELERQFLAIAESDQVPIAKLGLYASAAMQHLLRHREDFEGARETVLDIAGAAWSKRVAALFAATLDEAADSGAIRAVDTTKVGTLFLNSILSLVAQYRDLAVQENVEDDIRVLMDLYLNGLVYKY